MTSELRVTQARAVVTLTIDRPAASNALNAAVLDALRSVVDRCAADRTVRVLVLTGSGEKAFSAGADLKELAGLDAEAAHRVLSAGQSVMRELERAPIPVVAAVNGVALGGGFELVLAATIPVLSTTASLGLPESGLGLMPGYGGTQRLPRAVGARVAAQVMLTGARISADRAYELGLTPVEPVPPTSLMATAHELAERIAAQGPRAVRSILRALDEGRDSDLETGLALETELASKAIASIESAEGVAAFLERRTPAFPDPADER